MRKSLFSLKFPVAKLFAKHVKVIEQVEMLKQFTPIACGTPNRLAKLADIGALDLSRIELLVIDMNRDRVKNLCILDIKDIRNDLFELYRKYINKRVLISKCNICMV